MSQPAMEVTHEQIIDAHRRFTEAQWRLNVENQRTDEKVKWIISLNQQLREYQNRLREMNEASDQRAEKLKLVYKRIELHGQIAIINEGLKKAMELTARAAERISGVWEDLEIMSVERWEVGLEDEMENNSVFEESSSDELEISVNSKAVGPTDSQEETGYKDLILARLEEANTRISVADAKCARLNKRKQELIEEIENINNRKKDAAKARQAAKEKLQNASLKLYFVEFGAI